MKVYELERELGLKVYQFLLNKITFSSLHWNSPSTWPSHCVYILTFYM